MMYKVFSILLLSLSSIACSSGEGSTLSEGEADARIPGVIVDSAIPIPEAVRRFQALDQPVSELSGGAGSIDELLRGLSAAYVEGDQDALAALAVTRAEFGYLYYPESPYPLAPYQLAPDFLWYLIEENGARGVSLALQRLRGSGAQFVGYSCSETVKKEGKSRVWGPCFVTLRQGEAGTDELRLANAIVERDGRFKLLSFDNKL